MSDLAGIVLAAGEGKRLRPLTADIPKALAPIGGGWTILDVALSNLRAAGIEEVFVVVGYAAEAIERRVSDLEAAHGVRLGLVANDRALDWNNAYSLWLAREHFARGAMVVNGDTVHPVAVEQRMLAARGPGVLIALDDVKVLAEEEMKVVLEDGRLARITKEMEPARAHGEYIGVTLIEPSAAADLAEALERTWRADPSLYYEDGFQAYADAGGEVRTVSVGGLDWVEVDTPADLERARTLGIAPAPAPAREAR